MTIKHTLKAINPPLSLHSPKWWSLKVPSNIFAWTLQLRHNSRPISCFKISFLISEGTWMTWPSLFGFHESIVSSSSRVTVDTSAKCIVIGISLSLASLKAGVNDETAPWDGSPHWGGRQWLEWVEGVRNLCILPSQCQQRLDLGIRMRVSQRPWQFPGHCDDQLTISNWPSLCAISCWNRVCTQV